MILLIDNYDSFSYNLYQMVGAIEPDIRVIRNDACSVDEILAMKPSGIILSPGPGRPEDAGICMELVRRMTMTGENAPTAAGSEPDQSSGYEPGPSAECEPGPSAECEPGSAEKCEVIPVLGVCLGHQSICAACGGVVGYAKELMHGKTSMCKVDTSSEIFAGLGEEEQVGRYHSLAAEEDSLPKCLKVTARTMDGEIMAVEHLEYPVYGIQFHPESILTPHGNKILQNFVSLSRRRQEGK